MRLQEESRDRRISAANAAYHDRIADLYEKDITTLGLFDPDGACEARIRSVMARVGQACGEEAFLDLGSGTGHLAAGAANFFKTVIGTDVSQSMLKLMRTKGFEVVRSETEALPFPDGSFAAVGAFSVLHHLFDPAGTIREAWRVLKPGGWFYADWDPNRAYNRAFPVGRFVRDFVKRSRFLFYPSLVLLSLLKARRAAAAERRAYREFLEAEYHANFRGGLDPDGLVKILGSTGFREIEIHCHNNDRSLELRPSVPVLTRILNMNFKRLKEREKGRYFAVLARK